MKKIKSLTSRSWLLGSALAFMAIMFGFSSCRPDFDLDKRFPEWLGTSIYETLQEGLDVEENGQTEHLTFNYYVKLIDALGEKNILAKTGSRTLFVADDKAFERFLAKCPLAGNRSVSFDQLTNAQLKMILKGSMLNNVYQVAALSNTSTENGIRLGDCMRKVSSMSEFDTIRVLKPEDMPKSKFWDYVRNNPNRASKGALVMEDGTRKPLIFFAPKFLESRKITDYDYNFLFNLDEFSKEGKPGRNSDDASVNGVRIKVKNKKCFNGFIHVMEDVVYLLPSMAEYLAQTDADGNSNSKIFSSIIERFSAPYYTYNNYGIYGTDADHSGNALSSEVDRLVKLSYYGSENSAVEDALRAGGKDTVFTKMYFSLRYQGSAQDKDTLKRDPLRNNFDASSVLKFDPGWNSYFNITTAGGDVALQEDMAVMFVPTDSAMMRWWLTTTLGQEMKKKYGLAKYQGNYNINSYSAEDVAEDMSEIDLSVISELVNNNMFFSLSNTVPSKFRDLLNDAQDDFFKPAEVGSAVNDYFKPSYVDKPVVMCCNGAIYFTDMVFVPTAYKAVSYPAMVSDKLKVFNWAIRDKEMFFSYYLKSMATAYSLFIPQSTWVDPADDQEKLMWIDPASYAVNVNQNTDSLFCVGFWYKESATQVVADIYAYDPSSPEVYKKLNEDPITDLTFVRNRMKDILDYHIILLNDLQYYAMEGGVKADDDEFAYFRTKGGGTVRFKDGNFRGNDDPDQDLSPLKVEGGFQTEKKNPLSIVRRFDQVKSDGNGITYVIDEPLMTSRKSVYDILSDTENYPEFEEFFNLIDNAEDSEGKTIFSEGKYGNGVKNIGSKKSVSIFNTFNYTIYVPNNQSIKDLLKDHIIFKPQKLDDWEQTVKRIYVNINEKVQANARAAAWKDSIKTFFKDNLDMIVDDDDDVLAYIPNLTFEKSEATGKYGGNKEDENKFKAKGVQYFISRKKNELVNFLKYHIQDNSVYTNAEFNRSTLTDPVEYETAYLNKYKQYGTLKVAAEGDDITIKDEVGHVRTVDKKISGDTRYWNIMCREYVFKSLDGKDLTGKGVTDVKKVILDTSSYAVIHLISGALCNGEVIF